MIALLKRYSQVLATLPLMFALISGAALAQTAGWPNRAAPFFHLVPVFGSAMAILLLGEQPRLFHLVGYVLVLAGVVIASRQASAAGPNSKTRAS